MYRYFRSSLILSALLILSCVAFAPTQIEARQVNNEIAYHHHHGGYGYHHRGWDRGWRGGWDDGYYYSPYYYDNGPYYYYDNGPYYYDDGGFGLNFLFR